MNIFLQYIVEGKESKATSIVHTTLKEKVVDKIKETKKDIAEKLIKGRE